VSAPASAAASAAAPASRRRLDWHTPVRWFGLLCLMGSAFFAGYVAWLLWGTGLSTQRDQDSLRPQIEEIAAHPKPIGQAPEPGTPLVPGSAYAIIRIPSIDIDFVVVEGTDYADLRKGPGHYPDTANPWDLTGRVGIAGHRTTYLHPFFSLDKVKVGDTIELITEYGTFRYEVTRNFVIPEEGSGVVLEQTEKPTLVLTTCNPKYASYQRLIVEAKLVSAPPG
jgi:sortase A